MKRSVYMLLAIIVMATPAFADGLLNRNDGPVDLTLSAEGGFVDIITHTYQAGDPGTLFDFVAQGGQELLFPFYRYTGEVAIADRHTVIFLYQPLEIATQVRFLQDVTIDGVLFAAETTTGDAGVNVTYSFPFYRMSYLFDLIASEKTDVEVGASLQLRNASVRFESTDGTALAVTQDLGPVPIIKLRARQVFGGPVPGLFAELEADGFFASSAFFNGVDFDFSGSIFDVSLRSGFTPTNGVEVFANVRGLGGGANGTRPSDDNRFWSQSRTRYSDNFLTSLSITLGARLF